MSWNDRIGNGLRGRHREHLCQRLSHGPLRVWRGRVETRGSFVECGHPCLVFDQLSSVLVRRYGPADVHYVIVHYLLGRRHSIVSCIHNEGQLDCDFPRIGVSGPPCLSCKFPLLVARALSLDERNLTCPILRILRQYIALSKRHLLTTAKQE